MGQCEIILHGFVLFNMKRLMPRWDIHHLKNVTPFSIKALKEWKKKAVKRIVLSRSWANTKSDGMNGKSFLLDVVIHQEESFSVYVTICICRYQLHLFLYSVYVCVRQESAVKEEHWSCYVAPCNKILQSVINKRS